MAINLITAPTGGAPLDTSDYNAQNVYIQSLILAMNQTLHLTEWDTVNKPELKSGVYINHGGALFQVQDSDYTITGSPSAGRVYVKVSRSGDTLAASFVNSATGYSWSYVYNGFYHTDGSQLLPYVLWLHSGDYYKFDLSNSADKHIIDSDIVFSKLIDIGDWNMDTTITKSIDIGFIRERMRAISVIIRDDTDDERFFLDGTETGVGDNFGIVSGGIQHFSPSVSTNITLYRFDDSRFNHVDYNATSYNRGFVLCTFGI